MPALASAPILIRSLARAESDSQELEQMKKMTTASIAFALLALPTLAQQQQPMSFFVTSERG